MLPLTSVWFRMVCYYLSQRTAVFPFTGLSVVGALNYHLKSDGSSLRPEAPKKRQAVMSDLCTIRIIMTLENEALNEI